MFVNSGQSKGSNCVHQLPFSMAGKYLADDAIIQANKAAKSSVWKHFGFVQEDGGVTGKKEEE
jgi:hypothetical protein